MKVLIIGSGGREHTLAWKISQSQQVSKIYCAPGNGGTEEIGENVPIQVNEIDKLVEFSKDKDIDLTIVGPEDPLVNGIVDRFEKEGLKIFGVNKKSAQLEGSKIYSKDFMEKYQIPTAKYRVYKHFDQAKREVYEFKCPIVIKADGLCAGKGVVISETYEDAIKNLDKFLNQGVFGKAGQKLIIEEFLCGIEASLLCFVSNGKLIPMESAKDYKKIYENDQGPNTGGVGCFSPSPLFTQETPDQGNGMSWTHSWYLGLGSQQPLSGMVFKTISQRGKKLRKEQGCRSEEQHRGLPGCRWAGRQGHFRVPHVQTLMFNIMRNRTLFPLGFSDTGGQCLQAPD